MIHPRIPFTVIPLAGLVTMAERTLAIVRQQHPEVAMLTTPLSNLEAAIGVAVQALGSSRSLQKTVTVQQADRDRDNSYESLRNSIRAGLRRNNPAYREACERLLILFSKNNLELARLSYDAQTAALLSLFADLSTLQAVADLATIHATEWLQELKSDQERFEQAVSERGSERVQSQVPTDESARMQLIPALKALYKLLDVAEDHALIAGVDQTIPLLNAMIQEIITAHR